MPLTFRNQKNRGRPCPRSAGGFTIIELMAVLLIMLLLLAVLAPSVQKIYRTVLRTDALATVRLIEGGCRLYYEEMDGQYPPSTHGDYTGWEGRELLVLFLTGYGPDASLDGTPGTDMSLYDGCEGFGFRQEKRGLRFGPYNGAEKVKTKLSVNGRPVFIDAFGEEIYYWVYDAGLPGYRTEHNQSPSPPGLSEGSAYTDYLANAATMRDDFILVTAGANGICEAYDDVTYTDDITNYLEEQ